MFVTAAYAQDAGAAGGAGAALGSFLPLILIFAIMYFLLIRPQQKKAKEHAAMLGKLAAGDEVVTAGGILGKVVSVGDGFVTIEIAESVQIKVQKFQVSSLVPKGTLKGG